MITSFDTLIINWTIDLLVDILIILYHKLHVWSFDSVPWTSAWPFNWITSFDTLIISFEKLLVCTSGYLIRLAVRLIISFEKLYIDHFIRLPFCLITWFDELNDYYFIWETVRFNRYDHVILYCERPLNKKKFDTVNKRLIISSNYFIW